MVPLLGDHDRSGLRGRHDGDDRRWRRAEQTGMPLTVSVTRGRASTDPHPRQEAESGPTHFGTTVATPCCSWPGATVHRMLR